MSNARLSKGLRRILGRVEAHHMRHAQRLEDVAVVRGREASVQLAVAGTAEGDELAGHDDGNVAIVEIRVVIKLVQIEGGQSEELDGRRECERAQAVEKRNVELLLHAGGVSKSTLEWERRGGERKLRECESGSHDNER